MAASIDRPAHVKYRREDGFGLVYLHENYGYEDASLLQVTEGVVDVLEYVDDNDVTASDLERRFSPETVESLLAEGVLARAG